MMSFIKDFLKEEEGLAAIEYAVLAAAVVAGLAALTNAFTGDDGAYTAIADSIKASVESLNAD